MEASAFWIIYPDADLAGVADLVLRWSKHVGIDPPLLWATRWPCGVALDPSVFRGRVAGLAFPLCIQSRRA
jgi:hypothetical protein